MAARRLILAMIALLVLSSAAAALVPVDRDETDSSTTESTTTTSTSKPAPAPVHETISAARDTRKTIPVSAGAQLVLEVKSPVADQVEIPALGRLDDVDRYAPARFDLLLVEPGRYAVMLVEADKLLGRIVVRRRGKAQDEPRPSDSPGESTSGDTSGASSAS